MSRLFISSGSSMILFVADIRLYGERWIRVKPDFTAGSTKYFSAEYSLRNILCEIFFVAEAAFHAFSDKIRVKSCFSDRF